MPKPAWVERGHHALLVLLLLWFEYVALNLSWHWREFGTLAFRDPDDAMRLAQVRDFIAGQSWFDVSQHRVNPPLGGPMHWSRLIDMPIVGIILALRPLVGQALAESIACVTVPFATLGVIIAGVYYGLRDLIGIQRALFGVVLLVTCFSILIQVAPLHIDHHAWQLAMAAFAMAGLVHSDPRKGGWIMGCSMALWLHISSEGLPYAAIIGGIAGIRYAWIPQEWPRLMRYIATLAIASTALLLATHGWRASLEPHCDAMSPVYVAPLMLLFPLIWIGRAIAKDSTMLRRIVPVALAGTAAALLFLATAGPCLKGPFETLDPLVYSIWYKGVLEGLPIWDQDWPTRGIIVLPTIGGMIGLALAARNESDHERRIQWLSLLALAAGALAVAILFMRAMSAAHLFTLPGLVVLIAMLYPRIAALKAMPARVVLTASLAALSPAGLSVTGYLAGDAIAKTHDSEALTTKVPPPPACNDPDELRALATVPATTLFAPLDIGPAILQRTSHSVIGTAHHRNVVGMTAVVHAFVEPPQKALRFVKSTQARFLLFCPAIDEIGHYAKVAPEGLAAQLRNGHVPAWLTPAPVRGMTAMTLYRIN
jgi:hypothetical protein